MLSAIAAVHWPKGFWSTAGGYEFNLAILAAVVAIAATGPGRFSLDNALGWEDGFSGVWWGVGEAAAGVIASLTVLAVGRAHSLHPGSATESS